MVTGSAGKVLRLWSGVCEASGDNSGGAGGAGGGSITMEDEMTLDAAVTCAAFDDTMDMVSQIHPLYTLSNSIILCQTSSNFTKLHLTSLQSVYFLLQGIVGTELGTLWYINWTERTSIRLVSGHSAKVMIIIY